MSALKLAALDAEDLAVLSAHVQDAVLKVGDIDWQPKSKRMVIALNRFVWEEAGGKRKEFERRRAILHFARVEKVTTRNIRREAKDAVLELLAVRFEETDAPAGHVLIDFSGGGVLRLDVECIEAGLADLGLAWGTAHKPAHGE
ncbi:hypothetical protein HDIA_0798 [Hartmannibacter diazotrophicus]|uniref:DUF2948 family protein n=1 Tax=Hartmannibacter diazotrophicus TaxID=1482074 RepID=A0A2C9D2D3_9HYPH|nr:DUF2948 family protein [Hartmannibacter diazotrophicus]SON54339.1 hypothetical protein HDIA_0798 [Hartmannibacter diazotrophicus]